MPLELRDALDIQLHRSFLIIRKEVDDIILVREETLSKNTLLMWWHLVARLACCHDFLCLFVPVFLAGCCLEKTDPLNENLAASNARRFSVGLRQIKSPARFYWSQGGIEKWSANGRYCKFVYYNDDRHHPVLESDTYYTGRKFVNPTGKSVEEVYVTYYDYNLRRYYINYGGFDESCRSSIEGMDYSYVSHGIPSPSINLSNGTDKYEAFTNIVDAQLAKFGLNRLEYQPPVTTCVISTSIRW